MTDRSAVEELANRYSLAYDTADLDTLESVFTEDATFSMVIAGGDKISFGPRDAIMKLMGDSLSSQTDQRRHVNTNLIVEGTEGGVTRTKHYLTLMGTENGAITLLSAGLYSSEIVEDGGRLRFKTLHLDLDKAY
ncbi:nuclear transport factor 2 family protein [Nocardioides houyundeii]|uniref:nuclear transport factor 2 family protein n=1 Tax=Nocardioides houyundeii TaxID=2045452 RepID=UPI000DF1B59F|nr:nuclear transport factor 2 family protein [Nocardioides houyundeii]